MSILLPSLEKIQSIAGLPPPLPSPPPSLHSVMRLGVPVRRCLCVPINTPGWRGTLQGTSLKPLPKTQVSRFFETEINIIVHYDDFQSGEGEVARTLISHRYGSGSIPGSGDTCRLCFFFFFCVLVLASWVSLWDLPFCFPAKTNILIFFFFFT